MLGVLKRLLTEEVDEAPRPRAARAKPAHNSVVVIGKKPYPLKNWSTTGVLFGPYDGDIIVRQRFRMRVVVKDGRNDVDFDCEAVAVRKMGADMAAQFFQLHPAHKAAIQKYFAQYQQQG